jgi:DegV family protein with EDD domain
MTVRIVTDSNCDLPREIVEKLGITVIPLFLNIDGQSFLDGVDITREEFYTRLPFLKAFPTTSAPGIDVFIKSYRKLLKEGASHIISIHIASSLSNVSNIARLAKESDSTLPVSIFDSGQLTLGTGVQVKAAATAAAEGLKEENILGLLENLSKRVYTLASLDTLEFLRKSGRMNHMAYKLTSMLDIKPIIKMHMGVSNIQMVRTKNRSILHMMDIIKNLGPLEQLAVVHTHAPDQAMELREKANDLFPEPNPIFGEVTPVIGAHIGPGAVGFVAVTR